MPGGGGRVGEGSPQGSGAGVVVFLGAGGERWQALNVPSARVLKGLPTRSWGFCRAQLGEVCLEVF